MNIYRGSTVRNVAANKPRGRRKGGRREQTNHDDRTRLIQGLLRPICRRTVARGGRLVEEFSYTSSWIASIGYRPLFGTAGWMDGLGSWRVSSYARLTLASRGYWARRQGESDIGHKTQNLDVTLRDVT